MRMKHFLILLLLLAVMPALIWSGPRRSSTSSGSKPVHVREYTRKDGTVVHAHDRAEPGAAASTANTGSPRARSAEPRAYAPSASTQKPRAGRKTPDAAGGMQRDARGRIKRSESAKEGFQRSSPCPSTGRSSGGCKGYVIDHVKPLACGGADAPSNMQWQTAADAKAKDKWERAGCR